MLFVTNIPFDECLPICLFLVRISNIKFHIMQFAKAVLKEAVFYDHI
jgi:hypothetical protein